jgi:hypothetical protein
MPQVCSICKHPERAEIDRALIENKEPLRNIAEQYGTTATSLHRHKKHLPAELTKAKRAEEIADAGTLLDRVGVLISKLERIASKAEDGKQWLAAAGALREVGRCLRLLGELSGELGSGTTVNISIQLERTLSVVLGLHPEEFTRFCGTLLKEASEAQIHALLSAEETQDALCVNPLFDSRFNDEAVERAGRASLSDEERNALDRINAKLKRFRYDHQAVKAGTSRIIFNQTEMAL